MNIFKKLQDLYNWNRATFVALLLIVVVMLHTLTPLFYLLVLTLIAGLAYVVYMDNFVVNDIKDEHGDL